MRTYSISFTFPIPDGWGTETYVQSIIEEIDDITDGEANIIECKEVEP